MRGSIDLVAGIVSRA
jgi:hypothetical protein